MMYITSRGNCTAAKESDTSARNAKQKWLTQIIEGGLNMQKEIMDADGKLIGREVSTEQQSSIELSKNAKGDRSYKIKIYSDDPKLVKAKLEEYKKIAEAQLL